jgi:hypothetical protein
MNMDYSLGKGLTDSCNPYKWLQVYGVPSDQIVVSFEWDCAPMIDPQVTDFDLSLFKPNWGVAIALVVLTNTPGGLWVAFNWYRARDAKRVGGYTWNIPPLGAGALWPWYYVTSVVFYSPGAIEEDGGYYAQITVEGQATREIPFNVTGLAPAPVPTPGLPSVTYGKLQLPAVIRSALDSSWCNMGAGEWGSIFGIKFPPWGIEPGRWVLKGLDIILDGVNVVWGWADETWVKVHNAVITAGTALTRIDDWLSYAASWWNNLIAGWWASTKVWVESAISAAAGAVRDYAHQVYHDAMDIGTNLNAFKTTTGSWQTWLLGSLATIPPINTLVAGYNKAENFFSVHLQNIGDFFKDPPGWIFDKIDNWLNERVA